MKRTRWILALSLAMTAPVIAQTGEVVQATPSAAAVAALNRHLSTLARSPQNLTALLGAGQAALDLGDVQAANGFFTRANMVDGRSGKAKLGLAIVQIALKQPEDAAANFDAAEALGEQATGHLSDRGLAYDLTGQQAKAQLDYRAALTANPNDQDARTRYAVSLGISGQLAEANKQLETALAGGDREAWRMRAFVLAMNGRISDARSVTQTMMPKGLADAIDPYLQRLPLLTATQKAAAAHYGDYPANVLRLAAPEPTREAVAVAATSTRDSGSRRDRRKREAAEREEAARKAAEQEIAQRQAERERRSARSSSTARQAAALPPPTTALASNTVRAPEAVREAAPAPVREAVQVAGRPMATMPTYTPAWAKPTETAQAAAQPTPAPTQSLPAPSASMTQGPTDPGASTMQRAYPPATSTIVPAQTTEAQPVPSQPTQSQPAQPQIVQPVRSLADTLQTLEVPEQERQQAAVMADLQAVARIRDQRRKANEVAQAKARAEAKIEAEAKAKADAAKKAEAERKAKLAANPSRNWVQIATGRDVNALAFDLRRMRRTYADALGDQDGYTAEWGQTRRLLIGPFRKQDDAKAAVTQIVKAGGDAFMWQSEAGEEVSKIGAK